MCVTDNDIFEEEQQQIVFSTDTAQGAEAAMMLAKNAMLEKFVLEADTSSGDFEKEPLGYMNTAVENMFSAGCGDFANAQISECTAAFQVNPYWGKLRMSTVAKYLCSADDANEAKCLAANIAQMLAKKLKANSSVRDVIRVFQQWVNKNFEYCMTGSTADHTAIGVLRNGTGVCQGVAALAILVLPHLGVPAQYVSGQLLCDGGGWTRHAWNALKTSSGWIHADFTCGKDFPITPGTGNGFTDMFKKVRRWDEKIYSNEMFDARDAILERSVRSEIRIKENCEELEIGDVKITTPKPVIISDSKNCRIDLCTLVHLLGGGCMYLPKKDTVQVSIYDLQWTFGYASEYIDCESGYYNISLFEDMLADIDYDCGEYRFHF